MSSLTWKYVKALKNDNAVEDFATKNGLLLPEDMKTNFKLNNGGRPNKKRFDTEKSKGRVMKSLLSFNEDDLETIYDAMSALRNDKPYLVPIASDPGGNYICYNTIDKGIVLWLHETDSIEKVAADFTAFLNMLC